MCAVPEKKRAKRTGELLNEIQRLRDASEETIQRYREIQERIKKLEGRLESPEGHLERVKPSGQKVEGIS